MGKNILLPIFNDMFESIAALSKYSGGQVANNGLKHAIKRPHNLYAIKDENDVITKYKLEVVTTPFKKNDVKISISGKVLTVRCGSENYLEQDSKFMVYHGISSQAYEFSLRLSDNIDIKSISAKNDDGILVIDMPTIEKSNSEEIEIQID